MTESGKRVPYYAVDGLRACRFAAGLTQKELTEAVGSHQTRIAELETFRGATDAMFARLCEALGVFPCDLAFGRRSRDWETRDSQWWHAADPAERAKWERHLQVDRIKAHGKFGNAPGTALLRGLKACREASGLIQRELAWRIGSNQSTIVKLEKRYAPRGAYMKTIRKLCLALDVSPADLMCGPEKDGGRPG
jgi:transcriptional regulator with XRE-family HTH domain